MTAEKQIATLLSQDVDDATRSAAHLTNDRKVALIKNIVFYVPKLPDETARLKALSVLQAALGSLTTRSIPVGTTQEAVENVHGLLNASAHEWDVRRASLNVLALLFLKVRQLTPSVSDEILAAFKASRNDAHPSIREFVNQALGDNGIFDQRQVPRNFRARVRKHLQHVLDMPKGIFNPRKVRPQTAAAKSKKKSSARDSSRTKTAP